MSSGNRYNTEMCGSGLASLPRGKSTFFRKVIIMPDYTPDGQSLPARPSKICPSCGCEFTVRRTRIDRTVYCSRSCQFARLPQSCTKCGVIVPRSKSRKLCSNCSPKHWKSRTHGIPQVSCKACGGSFTPRAGYNVATCSPECHSRWKSNRQKGAQSHRWKGGTTKETIRFRKTLDYKLWRNAVYKRDDFTCQMCFERGGKLSAHHILLFSEREDLRTVVANGITLCWSCHSSIKSREQDYEDVFFAHTGFDKGR